MPPALSQMDRMEKLLDVLTPAIQKIADAPASGATVIRKGDQTQMIRGPLQRDSQRFSLTNFLVNGLFRGDHERANNEMGVMGKLRKAIQDTNSGLAGAPPNAFWMPLSWSMMGDAVNQHPDAIYAKAVMQASGGVYDPDEADNLVRRGMVYRKAQSAYVDATGGTLVAPPMMGEVIPLIRPQAAFLAAGAQTVTLPPQGRLVRPRIITPTVAQALGEGQSTPESDLGTGQMVLQAKKIAGAARISEEATAFTSGTLDQLVQADLARTLGLKIDAYGFYGPGGNLYPSGLTSSEYTGKIINIATDYPSAAGIGTNGNRILPEYGDQIPTLIEERSFGMDGMTGAWIMRPAALSFARTLRADAVTPGDEAGVFVDVLRRFSEASPEQFAGRKVVRTTNIKGTLAKGTGTDLSDAFYGIWQYAIMATYGAVQFTQGNDGNSFLNGQYLIRGLMWGDVGFEYPAAFAWYTSILGPTGLLST